MTTVAHFGVIPIAGGLSQHSCCAYLGCAKMKIASHFASRKRQNDDNYTFSHYANSRGVVPSLLPWLPRRCQSYDNYTFCT